MCKLLFLTAVICLVYSQQVIDTKEILSNNSTEQYTQPRQLQRKIEDGEINQNHQETHGNQSLTAIKVVVLTHGQRDIVHQEDNMYRDTFPNIHLQSMFHRDMCHQNMYRQNMCHRSMFHQLRFTLLQNQHTLRQHILHRHILLPSHTIRRQKQYHQLHHHTSTKLRHHTRATTNHRHTTRHHPIHPVHQ